MIKIKLNHIPMSLNEYINKCRHNKFIGAKVKKNENEIISSILEKYRPEFEEFRGNNEKKKIDMHFIWTTNGRKDPDNIAFAIKFVLDALVNLGFLPNDSHKEINSISHDFVVIKDKTSENLEIRVLYSDVNGDTDEETKTKLNCLNAILLRQGYSIAN